MRPLLRARLLHDNRVRDNQSRVTHDNPDSCVDSEQDDTEYVLTQMQKSRESLAVRETYYLLSYYHLYYQLMLSKWYWSSTRNYYYYYFYHNMSWRIFILAEKSKKDDQPRSIVACSIVQHGLSKQWENNEVEQDIRRTYNLLNKLPLYKRM